jgi:uncharacterized membrane protein
MFFLILKWLHVLSAILAVGSNATYGIWIGLASRDIKALPFTLKTIKVIDDRLANPAYGLLLITGLLMAWFAPISLTTPWLLSGLVLYIILGIVAFVGYTPVLKKQIKLIEAEGAASPEFQAASRRGTFLGIFLGLLAVSIVSLMVVKPALWG